MVDKYLVLYFIDGSPVMETYKTFNLAMARYNYLIQFRECEIFKKVVDWRGKEV